MKFDNDALQEKTAIDALGALAQSNRLALFRLLVQCGENGLAAGEIADRLSLPKSSLSFHLAHLERSGLISRTRDGRSLIYRVDYSAMNRLVGYLMENCCGGAGCVTELSDSLERITS